MQKTLRGEGPRYTFYNGPHRYLEEVFALMVSPATGQLLDLMAIQ